MLQRIDLCALARHVLVSKCISTKELGRRIGLSQAAVSRLASGRARTTAAHPALALIVEAGGSVHIPESIRPTQETSHGRQ